MLTQTINNEGLVFSVKMNGHSILFSEWSSTDDCIYYFPLATLADNGYAKVHENECTVPFENIYLLDKDERDILGVPKRYDKAIRLRGSGMLNTPDFKYQLDFLTHVPDGKLLSYERAGNIISIDSTKYLLSEEQYELIHEVEAFNRTDDSLKTPDFNFRNFEKIKSLVPLAHCELDTYLQNENVYVPDKIKIEIGRNENEFTIEPSVNIEENSAFQRTFDRMRKVQRVYPIQRENGERVRIVLNPEQQENLNHVKEHGGRHCTHADIQKIIEQPTEYFDPEVFDLSDLYSDRVIEIGVYKPKFYPFICPYKSCWIAGATVETPENGTAKLMIGNENDLQELNNAILDSENKKNDLVFFRNNTLGIDDAKFLAKTAEQQLHSPEKPIQTNDKERKVLIIEENAETVGFAVQQTVIETADKYTLFQDPFLNPDFNLKQHQEEGVAWLQHLYKSNANGCLMADDMGLGKTLQILYFIDWHSRMHKEHKPYLIVAPISLLENWENEYNRFFSEPRMKIRKLTSRQVPRKFNKDIVKQMQQMDIILTNYESMRNAQLNFCAVEFEIVALDEAQKIKSPGTMVTNAAKALKSKFKIAMTGTPVENSLLDLWCIMDFCVPGLLGNAKDFAAKYQNPLKKEDVDIVALGNEVHEKLGLYFIRRLKKDAAHDLPEKIELKQPIKMPCVQEQEYVNVVNNYVNSDRRNMLVTIMNIREISEHPYMFKKTLSNYTTEEWIDAAARMQATIQFLDQIKEKNEKVIIFAERRETQKMLQQICFDRYHIVCKVINGDTPSVINRIGSDKQSRQAAIDDFQAQNGFNIIIMSPIAAGMGLNVTAANHVIHYSRHWNPAKENQATDRAYRIGQTKNVYVYYPMAVSSKFKSFDETLDDLLSRKNSLATSTIFPTERVEVKQEELGQVLFAVKE